MIKWILPLITTAVLCACSHNPPNPSGSEFLLNPVEYYQQNQTGK